MGADAAGQHPLDPPHHSDQLAELRLRGGPGLRGPHRCEWRCGRDVDLRPRQPFRGGRGTGRADRRTPSPGHFGRVVISMAALTVATDRAAEGGAERAARAASVRSARPAAADRSGTGARADRAVRCWPLLVLAAPAAAEVWSGWVGIAQMTGLVQPLPGIWPRCTWTPLSHSRSARPGLRGVRAAGAGELANRRSARGQAGSLKWSAICSFGLGMAGQVAYHLLAQEPYRVRGMPKCPRWADARRP